MIQGTPDFFNITKKMHNALQGGDINLTDLKLQIYEGVVHENAVRNHSITIMSWSTIRSRCH